MTGSAVTPPRVAAPAAPARSGALVRAWPRVRAVAAPWGLAACLALAALTLLAPSAPTYDPWAWIVWGREIAHLDLSTTDGPSWKPLPVAFTTVFAPFGGAAPGLWMLVARTGAFYGVLAAFRLARRIGGEVRAGVPAGVAAAAGLALAPWFVRNAALGNSEGLQVAFALAAVDRLMAGRRRSGFALAVGLGLLRPEAWPFVGLLGAWLAWRERAALREVAIGLALLPACWIVPEWLGSGDPLRAAHRAQEPVGNSPAFASDPMREVLREGAAMLRAPAWIGLGLVAALVLWRRDWRLGLLAATIAAWTALVAAMTAHGYSGNARYLIVPAAGVIVLGAVGAAWGAAALLGAAGRLAGPVGSALAGRGGIVVTAVVAVGLGVAFAAPWARLVRPVLVGTTYQARLVDELGGVVQRAGGRRSLLACGRPWTGAYLVPAVAWQLGVHTSQVGWGRVSPPAVIFRVRTYRGSGLTPPLGRAAHAPLVVEAPDWHVVAACR